MKIAICPGSFDPVTNGHLDIIKRASKLYDKAKIIVIDTKSDTEVDAVEALIKKTIAAEDVSVQQYIRFSANPKYDLESIMHPKMYGNR